MTDSRFLYITTKDQEQARSIGRALVEARLVACVNILAGVESIYWWGGEIQDDHEAVLIAKTTDARVDQVVALVRRTHTYSCPCVVALPILEGNPDYLAWIKAQTEPASSAP